MNKLRPKELIKHRRDLGVVYQDYKLLPKKTAAENVALTMEVIGRPDQEIKEIVPHVLELVDLNDRSAHFPSQLSGGEQQRLAIARALVHEPKVLVADEPTGNIDPESAWEIVKLLEKINKAGIAQVPEGRRVFPQMTVKENLMMGAFLRNDAEGIQRDMETVFRHFPVLKERQKQAGGTLSGGEQQMLAMGRALMSDPRLILMDEPSIGL